MKRSRAELIRNAAEAINAARDARRMAHIAVAESRKARAAAADVLRRCRECERLNCAEGLGEHDS
jgi:hypothetical protein